MKSSEQRVDSAEHLEPAAGTQYSASFSEYMPRLRLRVMHRSSAELYPLDGFIPARRPLAGDLELCLVNDYGETTFVSAVWLHQQRVSFAEAEGCALRNGANEANYTTIHKGDVCLFNSHNGFALADLLVNESRRHELAVNAPVVVLMFDQFSFLAVCGNDEAALAAMVEIALQSLSEKKFLCSSQPIVLRDNAWEPFVPPAQLMPMFAKLQRQMCFPQIVSRQIVLGRYFRENNKNERIARVLRMEKPGADDALMAICICGETTLVPEVDFLSCMDHISGVFFYVRWADVQRVSPNSLQATQWTSFWRVTNFLYGPDVREHSFTTLPSVDQNESLRESLQT